MTCRLQDRRIEAETRYPCFSDLQPVEQAFSPARIAARASACKSFAMRCHLRHRQREAIDALQHIRHHELILLLPLPPLVNRQLHRLPQRE